MRIDCDKPLLLFLRHWAVLQLRLEPGTEWSHTQDDWRPAEHVPVPCLSRFPCWTHPIISKHTQSHLLSFVNIKTKQNILKSSRYVQIWFKYYMYLDRPNNRGKSMHYMLKTSYLNMFQRNNLNMLKKYNGGSYYEDYYLDRPNNRGKSMHSVYERFMRIFIPSFFLQQENSSIWMNWVPE